MNDETKLCPQCGKKMLKIDTEVASMSYAPRYPCRWWCGGCDLYGEPVMASARILWEELNK